MSVDYVLQVEKQLLKQYFKSYPEKSIAHLEELSTEEVIQVLKDLPVTTIAKVLNRLKVDHGSAVLCNLPDAKFVKLYSILDPVKGAHLLLKADEKLSAKKIELLSESVQKDIQELATYPPGAAGGLMDLSVRTCRGDETVKKVLADIRKASSSSREVFVNDIKGRLIGYIPVQELLFTQDETRIDSIMHRDPPSVSALSPREEVIETFESFKTTALPVTHVDGTLMGAIRYSSLVQAVQNQAISTMASLGGASPSEMTLSPPLFSVTKRLPWLTINLLTAFIASAVVGFFEATIAQVTALAVLLPVVAGQSGNTGAQAMAVTMRGLALREVRTRQWLKILYKELRVGFMNGVIIALVTGASVYFWSQSLPLGAVMTVAMIFSMIIASISGAGIPIVLTAMGKDPAQSSSVILTTVTDVIGFLSFLGLATLFISMLV